MNGNAVGWQSFRVPSPSHTDWSGADMAKRSVAERFRAKYVIDQQTGCWNWTACVVRRYGMFGYKGRLWRAHRASYDMFVGPIPDGLLVLHACDNPLCVNPAHLSVGTGVDNMQDCVRKGRISRGERRYNAKLDEEMVRAIRTSSEPAYRIAKRIGVDPALVQRVRRGRSWAHVPDKAA
jgi:hypothetical protein